MTMKASTDEVIVENGQFAPPEAVQVPEQEIIHILLPELEENRTYRMMSPRLAHPEQAAEFVMKVTEEPPDATL
jgi:hypothetical protein